MEEEMPPIDWLVEPLIAQGDRVMVFGEFGSFKSWGLLDLGLHLAHGRDWLGTFPIGRARRVLYVDEEMAERLLRRRVTRLTKAMGLSDPFPDFRALSRNRVQLAPDGVKDLLVALAASGFDPEVVIIETFRRVFEGDESSAKEVAAFWRGVEPIVSKGITLIISHHMRKSGRRANWKPGQTRDRISGSTDLLAGVDDALSFERKARDAFIVEHVKCREEEEVKPFVVTFIEDGRQGPVSLRKDGGPSELVRREGQADRAARLIEDFLISCPDQTAATHQILEKEDEWGVSSTTLERVLGTLTKSGRLQQPGRGTYGLADASADRAPDSPHPSPSYREDGEGGSPPPSPPNPSDLPSTVPSDPVMTEGVEGMEHVA